MLTLFFFFYLSVFLYFSSQQWQFIFANDFSTHERKVPKNFHPTFMREFHFWLWCDVETHKIFRFILWNPSEKKHEILFEKPKFTSLTIQHFAVVVFSFPTLSFFHTLFRSLFRFNIADVIRNTFYFKKSPKISLHFTVDNLNFWWYPINFTLRINSCEREKEEHWNELVITSTTF